MTGVAGAWTIESVLVNESPTSPDRGFDRLIFDRNKISIEPAGIEFSVNQSTPQSAILESRSQVFFAEFRRQENQLTLELSRPAFSEVVRLNASLPQT